MTTAWYICPYKRGANTNSGDFIMPVLYCTMYDYTEMIRSVGGHWVETEVLGNRAIVKVRAGEEIIDNKV